MEARGFRLALVLSLTLLLLVLFLLFFVLFGACLFSFVLFSVQKALVIRDVTRKDTEDGQMIKTSLLLLT